MVFKTSAAMDSALTELQNRFPSHCIKSTLPLKSWQEKIVPALTITSLDPKAEAPVRIPVLFTGGVHAREWAPPDALLSFCERLLTAASSKPMADITYSDFRDRSKITYSGYSVSAADVRNIVEKFVVHVVPIVNPDGRDFSLSNGNQLLQKMWRKNRREPPGNLRFDPQCWGVDINRNFPIAWKAETYYTPTAAQQASWSSRHERGNYRGPSPESEPETRNLMTLVKEKVIQYLVDVHMQGRTIFHPWGLETNQSTDITQSFLNPFFDHRLDDKSPTGGRDGVHGSAYGEFFPNNPMFGQGALLDRHIRLARSMTAEILASAGPDVLAKSRSTYTVQQAAVLPTTGAFDDYTFSQQFINPFLPPIHAYTLESGSNTRFVANQPIDNDGGFWPDFNTQFPKVEREIRAALFGLLKAI